MNYLYENEGMYCFMDNNTYEQIEISKDNLGDAVHFLKEDMTVSVMSFKGKVIGIDLPAAVDLKVVETDPGVRGDTATGGSKPAKLETGYVVKVPLFINEGETLQIDTRTGQYIGRAK